MATSVAFVPTMNAATRPITPSTNREKTLIARETFASCRLFHGAARPSSGSPRCRATRHRNNQHGNNQPEETSSLLQSWVRLALVREAWEGW